MNALRMHLRGCQIWRHLPSLANMLEITVHEAQNRHLRWAFPIVFHGLQNIFKKESRYFFQYLQFKFLEGGGCAKSEILAR
jgi:hypothetical protein